ncbi:MAG: hypothetical protein ACREH3_13250 [Geminicoccales bacterium]
MDRLGVRDGPSRESRRGGAIVESLNLATRHRLIGVHSRQDHDEQCRRGSTRRSAHAPFCSKAREPVQGAAPLVKSTKPRLKSSASLRDCALDPGDRRDLRGCFVIVRFAIVVTFVAAS